MSRKMLTVDDSPSVRKLVKFTLKAKGIDVSSAGDGVEALDLLKQDEFDGIILDINMPRMNGLEFLRTIKATDEYAAIPVIMLSTLSESGAVDTLEALAHGATDFVVKPTGVGSLSPALRHLGEEIITRITVLFAQTHWEGTRRRERPSSPSNEWVSSTRSPPD